MVSPEARKAHIQALIDMNPTEIVIRRVERVEADGAYTTTETTLPPQQVRIFRDAGTNDSVVVTEAGVEYRTDYFMLAPAGADIRADVNTRDSFTNEIGQFEVVDVIPSVVKGIVCGYQCQLVRVK